MNTFNDIEILWKKPQQLAFPDAADVIKKASAEKNQMANKILFQAISLSIALISMGFVLYVIRFQYASSYIGIALMFTCVIVFGVIRFRQSQFLKRLDFLQPPSVLLTQFEKFYTHQKWVNTKGILIYTIVLNIAFAFYFYETLLLAPFTNTWKIFIIAIYIAWMLIATLWLGKRTVKKEHEKTKSIIEKLKVLKGTLG